MAAIFSLAETSARRSVQLQIRGFVMKRFLAFLLTMVCIIAMLGCGNQAKNDMTPKEHQVTDAVGNKVSLPTKPKRIVSLTLGTDEIIMDLVEPERIVALSHLADDEGISHITDRSKKVTNKIKGYSAEAIFALKPDIVLIADWWSLNILQTLRDMGIKVYVYKTAYKVTDMDNSIMELARVLGEEEKGQELVKKFHARLEAVKQKASKVNKRRSIITISGHGVSGHGSIYDDMCNYANVDNCLRELDAMKTHTISKEFIIQKNPDIIILPSWNNGGRFKVSGREEMLNDASLATVNAVKNKQLKYMSGKSLFCGSHYIAESIEELTKLVYPEIFE